MVKEKVAKEEHSGNRGIEKKVGSLLILLWLQSAVLWIFGILFLSSFLLSPLQPILWMQILAVSFLIAGGVGALAWVAWRHFPPIKRFTGEKNG